MKIIVEDRIPFIRGVLEPAGEVIYLPAEEITAEMMADADALLTRTRTRCDSALLDGSRCRFIATATIGTDHIDLDYCRQRGITVCNAPGCNAPAVAQYVMAAIMAWRPDAWRDLTVGVVGVGNVGTITARWAESLGMRVLRNDPPRAARGESGFVDLDEIARHADVITFHTPLTADGEFPTRHLADEALFDSLRRTPLIVNAARGGVVDTAALLRALESGRAGAAAIDCWEDEPDISLEMLDNALIATPHIAGYSRAGKVRATAMAVDAFSRYFGVKVNPLPVAIPPAASESVTAGEIIETYDILADTAALKNAPRESVGSCFERLRNTYNLRREPGLLAE